MILSRHGFRSWCTSDDIDTLKAALILEAARAAHAKAELAVARAKASDDQSLIAQHQLRIENLTRQLYGPPFERMSRFLDQTSCGSVWGGQLPRMRSLPRWR